MTNQADHQSPHVDEDNVADLPWRQHQWIVHIPLCEEGRVIRIWDNSLSAKSQHFGVPFGSGLVLPSRVYHAGCYSRSSGNLGLVIIVKLQRAALFSPRDLKSNAEHPLESMHSKVYQDFPGYGKFTNAYVKQVKSFSPVQLAYSLFDNVPPAAEATNDKKRRVDEL